MVHQTEDQSERLGISILMLSWRVCTEIDLKQSLHFSALWFFYVGIRIHDIYDMDSGNLDKEFSLKLRHCLGKLVDWRIIKFEKQGCYWNTLKRLKLNEERQFPLSGSETLVQIYSGIPSEPLLIPLCSQLNSRKSSTVPISCCSSFFSFFFLLEDNCFSVLWCSLPYINEN